MRIIETKVYKFDELPEDIKEKAIENLYDINVDYEWWQFIYEDAEQIGLEITEFDIDRASYCKGKFTLSAEEVAANIIKDHGKDCETFKTASSYLKEHDPIFSEYFNTEDSKLEDKLLELEDEFLKSLCEDYRRCAGALKYWNHSASEEALARREEYGNLLKELTKEILQSLGESK